MKLHSAGIIPILVLLIGVLLVIYMLNIIFPGQTIVHLILYAAGVVFMFFVIRFFRFPNRTSIQDENAVYSGADGEVVAIETVNVDEYFNSERIQISVFMSVLNVHINWIPIGGRLTYAKHHPGKHLVDFNPKSSLINEHTTLVDKDNKGREVMKRQIAGALARRIICKPKVGKELKQGEMIGMIKFGSRIDILLPADAEVMVKIGDKTRGAKTLMARLS